MTLTPASASGSPGTPGTVGASRTDDAPYGLHRPDLAEARQALQRLYGHQSATMWTALLGRAGLTGAETDDVSFARLLDAMAQTDAVMALCARSLSIRATAHRHLTAAHTLIRDGQQ